jgi:hypothetical protein
MPEARTKKRARAAKARRKALTTKAGQLVREEVHQVRRGTRGARAAKRVIAIGLAKGRRRPVSVRRRRAARSAVAKKVARTRRSA